MLHPRKGFTELVTLEPVSGGGNHDVMIAAYRSGVVLVEALEQETAWSRKTVEGGD
jgi:hypothetical protein